LAGLRLGIDDESNGGFNPRQMAPEHVDTLESRTQLLGDEYNER